MIPVLNTYLEKPLFNVEMKIDFPEATKVIPLNAWL
jgi:hypothetical protein